jgi:glucosamine--fructose-6-phosphate aminotransferase (isomerizing)
MTSPENTRMFEEAGAAAAAISQQRRLNRDAVSQLAERLRRNPPGVVLTCARGSSDHAATFAKYLIETRAGVLTSSQAPSISSVYESRQRTGPSLCLAISQSGKSPDILAAVGAAKDAGAFSAALVNAEESPLAAMVDCLLPLRAGPELSVAATKSYIAALAGIIDVVAEWTGSGDLRGALDGAPDLLSRAWDADWSDLVQGLRQVSSLFVVGRGLGLGVAQEAALKFKETCGIHAEAFSAAEVRHGPQALIGPDFPVLLFRQSDETAESVDALAEELATRGGAVFVAGAAIPGTIALPSERADPAIEPMLQIQSFYRAVNALSLSRGLDPDAPPNLRKVTETV